MLGTRAAEQSASGRGRQTSAPSAAAGMRPGGASQRRDRQVDARALPVRQGVQDAGEVVTGTAGQVDHQAGQARIVPRGE